MNIEQIQQQVLQAKPLQIIGNNSQLNTHFANTLNMSVYSGIVGYQSEELVMTVKAGTTIAYIENILAQSDQVLPFAVENKQSTTIGGAYAIGSPELRDAVLGVKVIDGKGRILNFGGKVMKNVAGYDVSRLLVGSKGQLVAVCEISFRVLPKAYAIPSSTRASIEPSQSEAKQQIKQNLKNVFDPNGIFI
jgi:glycolate oxidase FAD binding subunit